MITACYDCAMGWDATFYFPKGTRRGDAEDFLGLIGYIKLPRDSISRRMKSTPFYLPPGFDPARLSSLTAQVYVDGDGRLVVDTRTNIWCTRRDSELQNLTLRELKRYFKGHFASDFGKNRYFKHSGPTRSGVEAACYVATKRFLNSIVQIKYLADWVEQKADQKPTRDKDLTWFNMMNPAVLTPNFPM